jgi:hypothetical protein
VPEQPFKAELSRVCLFVRETVESRWVVVLSKQTNKAGERC